MRRTLAVLSLLAVTACEEVPPPPESPPPPGACEAATARTREILVARCGECHQARAEGGLNYLVDAEKLVARGKVTPNDPGASRLLQRVRDGQMPPPDEQAQPPDANEMATIERWITCGAPRFDGPVDRAFLHPKTVVAMVDQDLQDFDPSDRRFLRYLSLAHVYNAGVSDDELQTLRDGVAKLVNSLSWSDRLVRPADVHPALLRLDLRDYLWSAFDEPPLGLPALDVWERLAAADPYGVVEAGPVFAGLVAQTASSTPVLRADWFVFAAARPPAYHDILRLPDSAGELEAVLGVDVAANLHADPPDAIRAGFRESGVSRNNRLLERHPSPLGRGYAYWKSYDFAAADDARKNLFERPLGPGGGPNDFAHDGGEIIFNLPNGLQAYLLVDGRGRRIDKGPVQVVRDERRPDAAVVNGLSCMSCHARGMIEKSDEIRRHVVELAPEGFSAGERARVEALYPPERVFLATLRRDGARFAEALEALDVPFAETEPVVTLAEVFEADLGLRQVAAELGMEPDAFGRALEVNPDLQRVLASVGAAGVERVVFERSFRTVSCRLRPETCGEAPAPPLLPPPPPADACDGAAGADGRCNGCPAGTVVPRDHVCVPAGTFEMGSAEEEPGREEDEGLRLVSLSRPLLVRRTPLTRAEAPSYGLFDGCGPDCPVESLDWYEAVALANDLSADERLLACYLRADGAPYEAADAHARAHPTWRRDCDGYRLPTEAEWEYLARAQTTTAVYTGELTLLAESHAPELDAIAWYAGNSGVDYGGYVVDCAHWPDRHHDAPLCGVHPVAGKAPNRWGLHDTLGNVSEWCWDWYDAAPPAAEAVDPTGPDEGRRKVVRGGSWFHVAASNRGAARGRLAPDEAVDFVGVRFVRSVLPD